MIGPAPAAAPGRQDAGWPIRPHPAGAVNWGLKYASQFLFFAFFVGFSGAAQGVDWRLALAVAVIVPLIVGMVCGWLYRVSFVAELSHLGLTVRRGVLTKRTDFVAYARMQSVVVKQGPLQRLFGIGDVLVQSAKQTPAGGPEQSDRRSRSPDAGLEMRFEGIIRNVVEFEHIRGFLLERAEQARVAPTVALPVAAAAPARTSVPPDLPGLFAQASGVLHRVLSGRDAPAPSPPATISIRLQPRARLLWTIRWSAAMLILVVLPIGLAFPWYALAASPMAPLTSYGAARVYYRHYRVQVQSEAIEVERGFLTLRRALIPFRRIQNVNVIAGPLERALGMKTLRIEAAGPNIAEGYIDGIAASDAEPLVAYLMGRAERARFDDALGDQAAARDARAQVVDELRAINSLLEQRAAAAGAQAALGGGRWLAGEEVLSSKWPIANGFSAALGGGLFWGIFVAFLLAALAVTDPLVWIGTLAALIGGLGAIGWAYARVRLRMFAFRFGPESLEVRHGVLFRAHDLIPYRRLQSVGVSSGPIERRLFGIWSVRLSTAGMSAGLMEFPGVTDPRPYADFLLAKARLSAAPSGESPVVELAVELLRASQLVTALSQGQLRAPGSA